MRVKICRKNVRCILKKHKNHAVKANLHRRFKTTVSLFVEIFFDRIPAFWQKNVRCTVGKAHDTVNKNFTFLEVSIWQKFVRCKARGKNQNENLQKIYIYGVTMH